MSIDPLHWDTHIVMTPSPGGPVPTPIRLHFDGVLDGGLCTSVRIGGRPVAVLGSTATNTPRHMAPPGTTFARPPSNKAHVIQTFGALRVQGLPVACDGDIASTCNDPLDLPNAKVVATGPVRAG